MDPDYILKKKINEYYNVIRGLGFSVRYEDDDNVGRRPRRRTYINGNIVYEGTYEDTIIYLRGVLCGIDMVKDTLRQVKKLFE